MKKKFLVALGGLTLALGMALGLTGCFGPSYDCETNGHDLSEIITVTAPTCGAEGTGKRICVACDAEVPETIPATGYHTYGNWTTVTEATCVAEGSKERTCTVCGNKDTETLSKTYSHTYGEYVVTTAPTCTEEGVQKKFCTVEGCTAEMIGSPVPETGHTPKDEWLYTDTRCWKNCSVCTEPYAVEYYHEYVEGVCTYCGVKEFTKNLGYALRTDENNEKYYAVHIGNVKVQNTVTVKDIIVPAEYNGIPVKAVKDDGFSGINTIVLPDCIVEFEDRAFCQCYSLASINMPTSLQKIGDSCFFYCDSLPSIVIPDSVTYIGEEVFHYCAELKEITIGSGLTSVPQLFNYNPNSLGQESPLEKIYYTGTIDQWAMIENVSRIKAHAPALYIGGEPVVDVNLTTATHVENSAFQNCASIRTVTLGESVKSIGVYSFAYCANINKLDIKDGGVETIDYGAFLGCASLANIIIGDAVTSIRAEAFNGVSVGPSTKAVFNAYASWSLTYDGEDKGTQPAWFVESDPMTMHHLLCNTCRYYDWTRGPIEERP